MTDPIFFSKPPFVVGTPVFLAIFVFTPEIPKNLFHEKDKPFIRLLFELINHLSINTVLNPKHPKS